MKNIQPYIIAGMTIIIVVLAFYVYSMNSDVEIYKQEIELSKLKKTNKIINLTIDTLTIGLSKKSTETVKKSNLIIKKIQHEKPIIIDTTDNYMYQYISSFRPKQD